MAVGGRKLRETLRIGSDEWHDFSCSLCAKDKKNVPAIKYCIECEENLCSTCLSHHSKFSSTNTHKILDTLTSQKGQDMPTQRCFLHKDKTMTLYCPKHDCVGCPECFSKHHSSCQASMSISDIVQHMQLDQEITKLESAFEEYRVKLDVQKCNKQAKLGMLCTEEAKITTEVKANSKLVQENIEKCLLKEVNIKTEKRRKEIIADINNIDKFKTSLEERKLMLTKSKLANNAEKFVQLKNGNSWLKKDERVLRSLLASEMEIPMELELNNNIKKLLTKEEPELGCLSEKYVPKYIEHERDINIKVKSNKNTCDCFDICLTSKGDILLSDFGNKQLKKLMKSNDFKVVNSLDLPDNPVGLCEVDSKQLAVTLINEKKVQFVSYPSLKLAKFFQVGDTCRGIACNNGQLYVCCGGSRNREKGEGRGRIEVFNLDGKLLRSYYEDFSCPDSIKVLCSGIMLVSDSDRPYLIVYNMQEQRAFNMTIKGMSFPAGFCTLGEAQWCITGFKSNNVVLVSEDGILQNELLTKKDLIQKPMAVCFDKNQISLIVVLQQTDFIKVYRMKW